MPETLQQPSGVILITGMASSEKTATAYSALKYLSERFVKSRALVTSEDPVGAILPDVCQSQVNPSAGFFWEEGWKASRRPDA